MERDAFVQRDAGSQTRRGLAETDETRRAVLYAEIQEILIQEGGQIVPYHYPEIAATRDNVHGYAVHPLLGTTRVACGYRRGPA